VLALGQPFGRPAPPPQAAGALIAQLDRLAAVLSGGDPAGSPPPLADLPGYPRTMAATEMLTSAVAGRATG
jgi:hypothetical protein